MSSQQSAPTNAASLRPRNRRLVSIDDDFGSHTRSRSPSAVDAAASSTSFSVAKAPSPLPSAHPSRSSSTHREPSRSNSKPWGFQASSSITSNSLFSPGAWETSWSSIQGLASTLLGSETGIGSNTGAPTRKKVPSAHRPKYSVSTSGSWGPSGSAEQLIAKGSQEDRLAQVQAKKREILLLANGHSRPDSLGRHKRRTSVEPDASEVTNNDQSYTRVYVHHVKKGDTLAGLSIRYNCPQTVIQKANRLWTNDSIQIREIAYVPVESCGIRGIKIPTPRPSLEIAVDSSPEDSLATPTQSQPDWTIHKQDAPSSTTIRAFSNGSPSKSSMPVVPEPPFVHDSWISVDHIPQPVQIAKLSRQMLGFFPPPRRKSISYSDTTPPRSPHETSQPSNSPNERGRPVSPYTRRRGTSSASASASYYLKRLRGPGGVGSLDAKTHSPGPPRDKLNELFTQHFPNISLTAPRTSFESVTSASSAATGLNELGGKVEGWMRKIATKRDRVTTDGDLIELVEGWDSGSNAGVDPREANPVIVGDRNIATEEESSRRVEEERLLMERFPMRGRVFNEQPRR